MPASNVPISATELCYGPQARARMRLTPALALGAGLSVALFASWQATAGRHMLLHVLLMSVAAPIAVTAMRRFRAIARRSRPLQLWLATLLQLAVFLYWHSPSGMMLAMHTQEAGFILLQGSLLAAACGFWWCIAGLRPDRAWHAIAALLVTGKLFCLVAVVLTFAPRPLYHAMSLAEQQLAGLIMITLCPLTYIASALWLCRRWLRFDAYGPAPT